ncbi:hypothetical protein CSKR_203152 [Clonorchis sinensis]|uniref:Uncharacterized protein n=1 Tax=Clonorchis sinensis TaxID=79923 RepID=A0A8T1M7Z5_CLOSI|nr:hypothetical protein CSKR_203152 [Clonorchis sinensis]
MEAECSRLGDRVFELSSELDRVNGVNRVLSAKCLEFGIECDGVESRLDVCGFDSDSQIVGVSSGDVQVPLSVSERSIVSSVSSGVQTDPDAVLCRLQRELASVRGEHLQLLSLCDRARSELAAKQFAADCLGVTSVVSVDVGQQTEACLLESVSSVGLGVDQDVFDTVPCDSLAASGAPVLDAIVSVDHSSSFDVIPSGISMCDVDQSVVGVDVVLGDGRSCVSERVVDVDMVGERAAPVVDRVSAGVFDVVDSDVMDAVVSKGIFVESSDLENRLADALCRIDVLEKEKCQLESQLSSVCASSMVDVMNSHVCGLPSVVRSVVTEPLLACSDVVCGDVKKVPESELSDLLSRLSSAEGEVSLLRDCLSKRVDLLDRMRVDLCGAVSDLGGMWNDISVLCTMRDAKSELCLSESVDFGCDSAAVSLPPVSRHMVSRSTSTTFEFSDSLFLSSIRSLSQCVRLCYVVSRCLETDVSPDLLSISTHLREPAIEDWSLSENFGGARILEFLWELCSQLHSCLSRLSDLCPTRVSSLMSEIGNLKRHNMSVTDENESLKRTIQAMCKPPTRHPILNRFSSEVTKSMSEVTTNFAPSHGSQDGVSIFGLTSSNLPDTASASDPSNWLPMDPVKQEQGELPGEMTDVPLDSQIDRAPVPPKHMLELTLSNEEVTGLTPSVEAALKEEIQKCEELQHQYNQLKQQFSELCEERMQLSNWNLCLRDSLKASELELLALRGQQGIQLTMETGTEPLIPWDRIVADILANCATSVTSVECGCQTDATASTPHTSSEVRSELLYSGDITLCTGYPPLPPKHLKQLTSDMGIPRNASDLQETIKSSDQIASVDLKTPEYDPQTSRSSELLLPSVCIFKQLQSGLGNELLMPPPRAPRRMHAYHATHEHIVTHDLKSEPIDIRNSTDETMVRSDLRRKTTFQNQNQESERPDTVISQVVHPVMSTSASLRVCESEASALPSLSATPGFSRVLVDSVCQSVSIGPTSPSVPADVGLAVSDGWIEYAGASMCDVGVGSSEMFGRGDVSGVVSVHLIGDSVSNADVGAPERVDVGVGPLEPSELSLSSDRMELLPPPPPCPVCLTPSFDVPPEVVHGAVAEVDGSDSSLLRTQAELSVELRSRGEQIDVLTRLVRDREAALCDVRYVVSSMEAECSRLGDRVFELSSELDRVNGVNRVLSAKCLEFGIECDGVESRLDVCGFDSDSQIVGVSSGDVQVPLSVSERSIVSSVSSGVQTDPDAVLCRLQRELASVRGEHLQLLSLCDRARSELAAKQFAADCLGVTSVVSVDVGQQTEACLLESVSSVGLGVDQDVFDTVPCDSLAASGAPVLDAIVSVDHSSSFDVIPSGISMCDVDQSVVGVDVVLGDGRSCVSERVVDVDMVGERAAPVVDRVSAGVFDVVDSDVMDAVVSKGIFVESSDLENRLADALCRIDVLEKEKCQLESQLSSVCASSMVDVMNSHVCGLPSVVRSVVTEPLLVACAGAVAVDVDVELLRLRSLHLEWSRVARSVVGVCDTFLGCESRDCAVSDLCPEVLESRCSAVFDLFRTRSEIQCQVENECNLLRERLAASSDFYGAAARELCNIRSVVDGLVVEFELFKSRFSRLLVSINELDELDVGQLRENLLDSLLLNSQDVSRVNDFVPEILPFSCPAETPQFLADGAEGPPGLIPDLKGIDSLFTIHEGHTICERVAMLGKEDVESSVYRSPNDPSKYLSSARLTSTIPAAESKECSTQAGVKLAVFDRNLWDFKENFAVMKRFVRASLSFSRWACSTLANEIKCHINLSPDHYRSFACELQELLDHLHQLQSTSTLDLTPLDEIEYSGALNLAVENSDKICSHAGSTSWETNLNEPTRKVSTEAATTTGINNDDSSMVADKRLASTKTDVLSTFVYALCLLVNKDQCCRIRHLLTEENPSDEFVDVLNGLLHRVELQLTAMSPSHRNSAEDSFPSAEATTSRRPDFSVEKSSCLQKFLNQLNVFLNNPRFSVCDVTAGEFRSYLDNILMKLNLEAPVTVSRTNSDHLIESGEFAVEKSGNIPLSVTDSSMDPIQSLEKEFQTILQSVIRCLSELPRCIENMQVQMGYEYSRPQSCGHTDLVTSLSDNLSRIPEVTELLLIVSVLQEALVQFEGHINEYRQRMRSDLISAQEDMKVLEIETVLERLGQEEVSSRLSEMLSHLLHPSTSAATSASAASPPLELKVVDEQLTRAPSIDSTTAPTHIKVKSACLPSENVNSPASNEAYEKEGNQPLLSGPRETICGSTSEETKDQLVENIHPLISATMNVDASTPTPYDPLEIKHVTSAQRLHRSHSVPVLRDVCFGCVEHSMPEKVYGSTSDVKDCENVYADQSARRLHLLRFLNILEAYFPAFLLHSSNYLHSVLGCFLRPSTIRSGLRFLRHLLLVIPDALLHSEPSELAVQLESQLQRTELHLRRRMTRLRGQLVSIPRQSPDLDARSFRPDLDQINRELEEVTRGYKCVHDLLPVCLPLHPDGPSCSSLLRLASLGTDVYPAFESILPPHIPLLTNESSVLYNNLLKRLLHLRDTEVLYLLMLIGHPLPSTESSVKQKLKKFANWNLVTPIDLHTMPVYRVPVDTIGAYLNTPGAISTTSIITAKPETDHYSTICLPSAVSGPDENNESSNAIVARSSTQLIHCLIQQSREIVENLRTRPDQPCPSSSSVVEGNLYRFEQRLSELIENLQTECLSLRISAQSPGAAHPESAVPSISESSGYPKRAARPPISDLIGAVDQMDELMELRNLAKHLFDQYNIVSSELEHNLDINWCLRQRLNAANEQIDQISKQLYRGHHSLACMEERLSLETEKHAMLTEQCDITRQQTRKTAHILEGLLEKHEHVPSTSADVRFDSIDHQSE